ncbi:MAG: diguanylate cyclase [Spirulinaceae cyanobacterium]
MNFLDRGEKAFFTPLLMDKTVIKQTILLIDRGMDSLQILSAILESRGYQVKKVMRGKFALRVVETVQPDLILLGIYLPDISGYEVCRQLKTMTAVKEVPIIFISASNTIKDKVKAFTLGGVDYITQPFYREEIIVRVENQIYLRFLQNQLQKVAQKFQEKSSNLRKELRERRHSEMEVRLLLAVTQTLERVPDLNAAFEVVLRLICQSIRWDLAEAWLPNKELTILECNCIWHMPDQQLETFKQKSENLTLLTNAGLPGEVFTSQQSEWIEDIVKEKSCLWRDSQAIAAAEFKTALGLPVIAEGEVIVVLVFFTRNQTSFNQRTLDLIEAISTQIGSLIQRRKTENALIEANQKLERLVNIDGLTGVANRRCFDEYLFQQWQQPASNKSPVSLILCDVDFFKLYNDTYGHQTGDDCLQKIAQMINQVVTQPANLVARYGGEEFVVILPNTNIEEAVQIAESIRQEVKSLEIPHNRSPISRVVTLSIGVASTIPQAENHPHHLVENSDRALYAAKAGGRNCVLAARQLLYP